jgi:hypothetical protein
MSTVREKWTDERLDDLSKHMGEGFRELREEIRGLRQEMTGGFDSLREETAGAFDSIRAEMNARFERVDARFDALNRTILQVGGGLIGAVLVGLMGLIATQL